MHKAVLLFLPDAQKSTQQSSLNSTAQPPAGRSQSRIKTFECRHRQMPFNTLLCIFPCVIGWRSAAQVHAGRARSYIMTLLPMHRQRGRPSKTMPASSSSTTWCALLQSKATLRASRVMNGLNALASEALVEDSSCFIEAYNLVESHAVCQCLPCSSVMSNRAKTRRACATAAEVCTGRTSDTSASRRMWKGRYLLRCLDLVSDHCRCSWRATGRRTAL